jgi:uncharacterized protein (UPF0335 family)
MSVWTTKALDRDRNYIVIKHSLKGVNHIVNGVKFRDSYAVVEKDSKTYFNLKRVPNLKATKEFPLLYLLELPFITKISDIKTVYGQDVYRTFLKQWQNKQQLQALQKQQEEELLEQLETVRREEEIKLRDQITEVIKEAKESGESWKVIKDLKEQLPKFNKCTYRKDNGELCNQIALDYSPTGYCHIHIFHEPVLEELGIDTKKPMTKSDRKEMRQRIERVLTKKYGKNS